MKNLKTLMIILLPVIFLVWYGLNQNSDNIIRGNEITDQNTSIRSAKKTEISLWAYRAWKGVWGYEFDGKDGDWENVVIKDFERENLNIKINLHIIDADYGPRKVNIAIASGLQPDIMRDELGRSLDYAQRGLLLNLDGFITDAEREAYIDGVLEQCKGLDGKQYLIPWVAKQKFMLVNRNIFKQRGAEKLLPKDSDRMWTYDEFKKALKAVNNPDKGIYGCGLYASDEQADDAMICLLENFGAKLIDYSEDGKPYAAINSETGIKAANFIRSLTDEKLTVPEGEMMKATDCQKLFTTGKIAVLLNGSSEVLSSIKTLMDQAKVDWFDIYPVMYPYTLDVMPHVYKDIETYEVFKSADHIKEKTAVDFCRFITSKNYINQIKPSMNIPSYKYADNLYAGDKYVEYGNRLIPFDQDYYIHVKGFMQIRLKINPYLRELLASPEKTSPEILEEMTKDIQYIIDEGLKVN